MNDIRKSIAVNSEKVELWVSRGEMAGLMMTVVAVVMMVKEFSGHEIIFLISLSLLSFIYVVMGIFSAEIFRLKEKSFFSQALLVSYFGLSITTTGILFLLQRWPGAAIMVEIGCAITAIMFIYFIYKLFLGNIEDPSHRVIINNLTVRMLPALLVGGFLIMHFLKN